MKQTNPHLLTRGVSEVIDKKNLEARLSKGDKLRVKFGIDPTGDLVHIGHAIPLLKLREFQEAGHTVILLIGDFTATIGDPTGRNSQRLPLSKEQIKKNMKTYKAQVGRLLDIKKVEIRYNSEWYNKFSFTDFTSLASNATIAQLSQRADFKDRLEKNIDISLNEFLYPVLQGYDSVMLKADVELGGTDQKFNLLMGRQMQKRHNQREQDIIMTPLLEGLDGVAKMSKSLGNFIAITDEPNDMYGKAMSIPDSLLWKYFELCTSVPEKEVQTMSRQVAAQTLNPRDAKMALARELVTMYHGEKKAQQAELNFIQIFQQKQKPSDMPTFTHKAGAHPLIDILIATSLATSKTDARKLIEQKAVRIDDVIVSDVSHTITIGKKKILLQKGKRYFVQISA